MDIFEDALDNDFQILIVMNVCYFNKSRTWQYVARKFSRTSARFEYLQTT